MNDSKNDTSKTSTDTAVAVNRVKGPSGYLYADDGGSGGIPVLFVHSFGGSTLHWKNQLDHLRQSRRAVAFDLRGHGRSDLPSTNDDYNPSSLANDIAAVADSLQLNSFVLVGHSMGGAAAIAYASAHPNKVAGLVLAGTPGKTPPDQAAKIMSSLESDAYQQVMDDYMKQLLANAKPGNDTMIENGFRKVSKESSIDIIRAMFNFDPLPFLKAYKGPVLIISTEQESKQPNSLAKQVKDIENKTITGTSHWMQMDKPGEFNQILDDFLKKIK